MSMNGRQTTKARKHARRMASTVTILPDSLKTSTMRQVELRYDEPLEVYLMRRLRNGDQQKDIAKDLSISEGCLSRWVKRLLKS